MKKRTATIFKTVGLALSIAAGSKTHAETMSFQIVEQGFLNGEKTAAIFAEGDIAEDSRDNLKNLVERENIKNAVVYFNSTGGLVIESIKLGQYIRSKGFGTSVKAINPGKTKAICASACVYAYAGGVARYLDDETGVIGVHQYYSARKDISIENSRDDLKVAQLLGSVIVAHLQQMEISPTLYVAAAMTEPSEMLWINKEGGESFDLVNNGELPPKAEIKLTDDGFPFLQISQIADKGHTHIMLSCAEGGITITAGAIGEQKTIKRTMMQSVKNSIKINDIFAAERPGQESLESIDDNGVQIQRTLGHSFVETLNKADTIGFMIEGINGRWIREISVAHLKDKIRYYTRTCR